MYLDNRNTASEYFDHYGYHIRASKTNSVNLKIISKKYQSSSHSDLIKIILPSALIQNHDRTSSHNNDNQSTSNPKRSVQIRLMVYDLFKSRFQHNSCTNPSHNLFLLNLKILPKSHKNTNYFACKQKKKEAGRLCPSGYSAFSGCYYCWSSLLSKFVNSPMMNQ